MRIVNIVGARPQFVKASAVSRALSRIADVEEIIVHTGQHYDVNMSRVFFQELAIPAPAVNLGVGSGTHGWQIGETVQRLESTLVDLQPDYVVVYGDTNSTLAAALIASRLHIPVAHIEAGLRGYNKRVPEEVNRLLTDHVSDLLFCPSHLSVDNLATEGITKGVYNVGDVMYDVLLHYLQPAESASNVLAKLGLTSKQYYLATVHRVENTNDPFRLISICSALATLSQEYPVVFPMHPRTRKVFDELDVQLKEPLLLVEPMSYFDMLVLEKNARIILTDSGGVQKEAYWLEVPCVTMEDEKSWLELFDYGYNILTGADEESILVAAHSQEESKHVWEKGLYGCGDSVSKIVDLLLEDK